MVIIFFSFGEALYFCKLFDIILLYKFFLNITSFLGFFFALFFKFGHKFTFSLFGLSFSSNKLIEIFSFFLKFIFYCIY